jgi:hypothetical protein
LNGDLELPSDTSGSVIYGPVFPVGWSGASVGVGFECGFFSESEIVVNIQTGSGVGVVLAVLISRAFGNDGFEFF